jgi:NAD(P)-dependent dehydrogenase (short-subunit alcohol dehydrogenase family)
MPFHPSTLPDLSGRVYIVTGATSGIGYHTAARLAEHNAHVYICARTAEKGQATASRITSTHPHARVSILVMDHTRLSSVVAAAKDFLSKETALHGLVNNAGIMATPFAMTPDGYEEQWQTNYLAHWVFTTHLLPTMRTTAKKEAVGVVRIVNLTSVGHYSAPKGGINFSDTSLKDESVMARYGQSKLANVLHTKTLHKLCGPSSDSEGKIWLSAVHPGFVKSELGNKAEFSWWMKAMVPPARWMGLEVDADKGAWTSLFCVAAKEMKQEDCGKYWQRFADPNGWQSGLAKDLELAEKLDSWTKKEMEKGGWMI